MSDNCNSNPHVEIDVSLESKLKEYPNESDLQKSGWKDVVVVVEPYSSSGMLCEYLQDQGHFVVGVLCVESFDHFDPYPCNYILKSFDHDVARMVRELEHRHMRVSKYLIGCESGVSYYDKICHELNLPYANDFAKSSKRRNKFEMQEQIKADGIRGIKQKLIDNKAEGIAWIRENLTYPLIIKPVDSAGTEGVTYCLTETDAERAIDRFLGAKNVFGMENKTMLIQEFLKGYEYVVDVISKDGRHIFAEYWKYTKSFTKDGGIIYHVCTNLDLYDKQAQKMFKYIERVVTSLGIRWGPSHNELMLLDNGEIVLIESGARMHGGKGPYMQSMNRDLTLVNLTYDVYFDKGEFEAVYEGSHKIELLRTAIEIDLVSPVEGYLTQSLEVEEITSLESYIECEVFQKGDQVMVTRDLVTSPGYYIFMHEDYDTAWRDATTLLELDKEGSMYQVSSQEIVDSSLLSPEIKMSEERRKKSSYGF